ncbi:beta-propeller fold lactonase family protein [Kineococcus radiotolerans]|uniref:Secreted protein n=1 Tax=Kineococcus radiotolerans (strain ATCC BAA-149 / DSM 14245 / SRS30216) TaxID=266940 RepID=A6WFV3_KINRD|nr:beta-propeller fold lactonase family protein [Kineococcus radiotolerans]ABS05692.1 putative secreted protein [Kineococcus radiotolerans SRS30216 = ATCC BAA-149]
MTSSPSGPDVLAVGSYTAATGGRGAGVTLLPRDPRTGRLGRPGLVEGCSSPSFLAAGAPGTGLVHAAHELDEGRVSTRRFDGRAWELRGESPSGGASPCHLTLAGEFLLAANYGGGVGVLDLDGGAVRGLRQTLRGEGSGPDTDRQDASHPHSTRLLGDDAFAVLDLGTDEVRVHALDAAGASPEPVQVLDLAPGTGPRHAVVDGDRLHVVGELDVTVTSFALRAGRLSDPVVTPALAGPGPAAGRVHPSEVARAPWGLVVAHRGADVLTLLDLVDGVPRPVRDVAIGARNPRHVLVLGHHLYVAAQDSDLVVHLTLGEDLSVVDRSAVEVGSPTCVLPL